MKTPFFGLVMATSVLFMSGCEKDNPTRSSSSTAAAFVKKPHEPTITEKYPLVTFTTALSGFCGTTTSCGSAYATGLTKNNQIAITNTSQSFYSSLTYTFYKNTATSGVNETYTPITSAQYTCSATTSQFANSYLDNGVKILIFANDPSSSPPSMTTSLNYNTSTGALTPYPPSSPSSYQIVTMPNFKGQSCQSGG